MDPCASRGDGNGALFAHANIDSVQTPWIDPEAVRRAGGVIVWQMGGKQGEGMPEPYGTMFRDAKPEAPVRLTIRMLAQTDNQSFGVSVIVPRDGGVAPSSGGDARARRPQRRGRPCSPSSGSAEFTTGGRSPDRLRRRGHSR